MRVHAGDWLKLDRCVSEWIKLLRGEPSEISTTGRDARRTVEIAEAAARAETLGRTIALPITPVPWEAASAPHDSPGASRGANPARFDHAAPTWDADPMRRRMAATITAAILTQLPVHPHMTALDYGCGTGLVTLALQPHVRRITGMDSSPGMLAVLDEKVRAAGIANVETCCVDLATQPAPELCVDLVVSVMALHHIADVPQLLRALTQLLAPGGYLALADLDSEDGSFHEDKTGVYHSGFDRAWLIAQLEELGYTEIHAVTAHTLERPTPDGNRHFPIFLISGCKPEFNT